MDKEQKNVYLEGLEFGEELLNKGEPVSYENLKKHLETCGYKFETEAEQYLLKDFARETFHIYVEGGDDWKKRSQHYINTEGYFKLLEYRELNQARASANEARKYAIAAIVIAIITLLVSIVFSYLELVQ